MPNNYEPIDDIYNSFSAYKIGKEFANNEKDKFKIGKKEFSKTGVALSGLSLATSFANWNENRQREKIIKDLESQINAQSYINVPQDNRYNYMNQDMYSNSMYQQGGNAEPILQGYSLPEVPITQDLPYDFAKTKYHKVPYQTPIKENYDVRARKVAEQYIEVKRKKAEPTKEQVEEANRLQSEYLKGLEQAQNSNDAERINYFLVKMQELEPILSPYFIMPQLDCLGSSCMYADKYFKKDYQLPKMQGIKDRLVKYTNENEAGMAAWNFFGALKKDNPLQIDFSAEKGKKYMYKDLPEQVRENIVVGSSIGFTDGTSRGGINEQEGIPDTRHHAIVIGFDKDKIPIIYDYGEAKRLDNPKFGSFTIGAIATPMEYRNANLNAENTENRQAFYTSSAKKYYDKTDKDDKDLNEISRSLIDNKEKIKKDLDLNEYDYNRLASYLLAISKQETSNYNTASKINDSFSSFFKDNPSVGAFQIKSQTARDLVKKYNLPEFLANDSNIKDPYNSAILAMYLAKDIDVLKEGFFKQGLEPKQNVVVTKPRFNIPVLNKLSTKKETINTPGNNPDLSEIDKFAYAWNSPNKLITGQAQGDSEYVKNVKKYLSDAGIEFDDNNVNIQQNSELKFNEKTNRTPPRKGRTEVDVSNYMFQQGGNTQTILNSEIQFDSNKAKKVYHPNTQIPMSDIHGNPILEVQGSDGKSYKVIRQQNGHYRFLGNVDLTNNDFISTAANWYEGFGDGAAKRVFGALTGVNGYRNYINSLEGDNPTSLWNKLSSAYQALPITPSKPNLQSLKNLNNTEKFINALKEAKQAGDNLDVVQDLTTPQYQEGGNIKELIDSYGYKQNSPFKHYPYLDIHSDTITMRGVEFPIFGISDTGESKLMKPNRDYYFKNANRVREIPLKTFQKGGEYEEWQIGYEPTEDEQNDINDKKDIEDYLKNNPFDYDSIASYVSVFQNDSNPNIKYSPELEYNINKNKSRIVNDVLQTEDNNTDNLTFAKGNSTVAQRHNTLGNIKYANWMSKYGATPGEIAPERDGTRFAKFPSFEHSKQAHKALLLGSGYRNLTVKSAMDRYAANTYDRNLYRELSPILNKKVSDLSESELEYLMKTQTKFEDNNVYKQYYGNK